MFIANCKKQKYRFNFRVPERNKLCMIDIPSGHQVDIAKEFKLNAGQIARVIEQCERYGFKRVSEIGRQIHNFSGMLYEVKPVSSDNISAAHEIKVEAQEYVSAQESIKGVLGAEKAARDPSGKRLVNEIEVEVIEDVDPKAPKKEKRVNRKIGVSEQGSTDKRDLPVDVQ